MVVSPAPITLSVWPWQGRSRAGNQGSQAGSGKHSRCAARGVEAAAQRAIEEPGAAPDLFAVAEAPSRTRRPSRVTCGRSTMYKDSGSGTPWPMLTKTNYHKWSLLMKVKMLARRSWTPSSMATSRTTTTGAHSRPSSPEYRRRWADRSRTRSRPRRRETIAAARIGVDSVLRATLQRLLKEWENLAFRPGPHGGAGGGEATSSPPKKYAQLKIAIETLLDFQDLTIEKVTGRLKTVDYLEEESPTEPITVGGKLMYTEEQWLAQQKEKKGGDGSGSFSSSKEPRRRPRGGRKQKPKGERGDRGDGGQGEKAGGAGGQRKANRDDTCLNCHQEDIFCSKADASLDIDEPRARAFLNTGSEDKLDGWYLDSGATHHMTGRRELFSDLDTSVRGSVRFGDTSRVEIQGVGSIVF
ncbi:uncharacterized protein [Miscanthus floridulus]|uniref:uncharacterized protein n=1 Tax=Miscanthus floridulus TaxID=154761 RepID=UPI00345A2951